MESDFERKKIMKNNGLHLFGASKEFQHIKKSVSEKISPLLIHGSEPETLKWLFQQMSFEEESKYLLIFEDDIKAKIAASEMEDAVYLPSPEWVWFDSYAHSKQTAIERVEALTRIGQMKSGLVCTSFQNTAYYYMPPSQWLNAAIDITLDTVVALDDLVFQLFRLGYERVDIVESKGQYSIRGGILDVFSSLSDVPYRVEFFGDEVDSLRSFDIESQVSIEKKDCLKIFPCREWVWDESMLENAAKALQEQKKNFHPEKQGKIDNMIEHLNQKQYVDGIEKYSPLFVEKRVDLLSLLSVDGACLFSSNQVVARYKQFIEQFSEDFSEYLERQEVVPEQFENVLTHEKWSRALLNQTLFLSELLGKRIIDFKPQEMISLASREMNQYFGKIDALLNDLMKWKQNHYKIFIALDRFEAKERLKKHLESNGLSVLEAFHDVESKTGEIVIAQKSLSKGFCFDTFKVVVLTTAEIFGEHKKVRSKKSRKGKEIKAFSELNIGDYIVHESHGVGQYLGVEQVRIDQVKKDFLKIKYAKDDHLYIPVEHSSSIQKYIGTDVEKIKLNKLGGTEWRKTKNKAKKAIEEMAEELIELYAERQKKKGYAFSKDGEWVQEFEAMFPYQETPDQLKCIEEIKADMETDRPMERLLCGDVGFGKTEVAIRAAFKAVLDSKQVAILVPTTILAQQHYNNIKSRFSKYPANVQVISRFKTKKEQEKIIEDLRTGVVDVVVGTHRILSQDVKFKDLGLLIVDEEQRFGVKHKERLKQLKDQIDVLTLTATPIPRTLHMSMIGVRDLSVIEDPPEDRYPIQTYVVESNVNLLKEAITRELERNGQVFFVHNRVSDIETVTHKIQNLVPEARVKFAHGQMNEHQLETLMIDFMNHEFDVLVCTTIIETGMDISNVNTIIINDGDRFGLSQLYQLRGRVGRSNRLAYCYIFYQANKMLTEIAEKRLRAIKTFTDLGAGFKIAMRDLEIRGAGNILGTAQHGHMEAIGYDLYCKLLDIEMKRRKGETIKEKIETKVELQVNAYIPKDYITNPQIKVEIYKKIAAIENSEHAERVYEEIEDRFGTVPMPLDNLISIASIKGMAEEMGVELITEEGSQYVFKFEEKAQIHPFFISQILSYDSKNIKFTATTPSSLTIKVTKGLRNKEERLKALEKTVKKIYSFYSEPINS